MSSKRNDHSPILLRAVAGQRESRRRRGTPRVVRVGLALMAAVLTACAAQPAEATCAELAEERAGLMVEAIDMWAGEVADSIGDSDVAAPSTVEDFEDLITVDPELEARSEDLARRIDARGCDEEAELQPVVRDALEDERHARTVAAQDDELSAEELFAVQLISILLIESGQEQ